MRLDFLIKMSTEDAGVLKEPSLFEELWDYFIGKYFSVQSGQYEHINLGTSSIVTMQTIILGIFLGIILAAGIVCYDKNRLGAFVRAIIRNQCLWKEKAMTLDELGFAKNGSVKMSLRSRNKLGHVVHCVEKEEYEQRVEAQRAEYVEKNGNDKDFYMPEYRINFETDHFYIPDEKHYAVDLRYENKGSGWRAFLLVIIVSILGAALLCFLLPDMLQLVDNMIDILTENDKVLK